MVISVLSSSHLQPSTSLLAWQCFALGYACTIQRLTCTHTVRREASVAHSIRVVGKDGHHVARGDLPHPNIAIAGTTQEYVPARVPIEPLTKMYAVA